MKGGAIKTHEIFMSMSIRGNLDDTSWKKLFKNNCVKGTIIFCTREGVPCSSVRFNPVWKRSSKCTAKNRVLVVWGTWWLVSNIPRPAPSSKRPVTLGKSINRLALLSLEGGFLGVGPPVAQASPGPGKRGVQMTAPSDPQLGLAQLPFAFRFWLINYFTACEI